MTNAIKDLEAKGYIVKAVANMEMGKLNTQYPIVYDIMTPDYTDVYGANGIAPEMMDAWNESLPSLAAEVAETKTASHTHVTSLCPICHTYCYGDCTAAK